MHAKSALKMSFFCPRHATKKELKKLLDERANSRRLFIVHILLIDIVAHQNCQRQIFLQHRKMLHKRAQNGGAKRRSSRAKMMHRHATAAQWRRQRRASTFSEISSRWNARARARASASGPKRLTRAEIARAASVKMHQKRRPPKILLFCSRSR